MICKECANVVKVAGQGFTQYTCQVCESTFWHHNTRIPKVCYKCSEKHNICEECGRRVDENGDPINE